MAKKKTIPKSLNNRIKFVVTYQDVEGDEESVLDFTSNLTQKQIESAHKKGLKKIKLSYFDPFVWDKEKLQILIDNGAEVIDESEDECDSDYTEIFFPEDVLSLYMTIAKMGNPSILWKKCLYVEYHGAIHV